MKASTILLSAIAALSSTGFATPVPHVTTNTKETLAQSGTTDQAVNRAIWAILAQAYENDPALADIKRSLGENVNKELEARGLSKGGIGADIILASTYLKGSLERPDEEAI
ncbi:hypothetical protein B0T21DRAFT_349541 [Apiosordaria backusii]|uniref:Uncharacterized protein n=1 Tax=Apiosordaria backusii TaxID=314023 RepID=A0AA40BE21_9PEZI|nr:hypothetical protein B0T21DRAFT_349541 [Apiosordaria backusii]